MMILCLLAIQCENDYISRYLWIIWCNLLYYACLLICFYRRRLYLYFYFMFCVLGDMLWICDTWILISTFFYDLSWFFHNFFSFLCNVLCVSSESDSSLRDRSGSVPAESAAVTATLNHVLDTDTSSTLGHFPNKFSMLGPEPFQYPIKRTNISSTLFPYNPSVSWEYPTIILTCRQ